MRPDHQSLSGFMKKAASNGFQHRRIAPGITTEEFRSEESFRPTTHRSVFFNATKGIGIRTATFQTKEITFITGSRQALADNSQRLGESGATPLRISQMPIPPDHQITLFNIEADRKGT